MRETPLFVYYLILTWIFYECLDITKLQKWIFFWKKKLFSETIFYWLKIIFFFSKVYNRGVKWGLTLSHIAAIEKVEQLAKHYDENVLKWKVEQEQHKKVQMTLETISEYLKECDISLSDADLKQNVKEKMRTHFDETVYGELYEEFINTATPAGWN